MTVFGKPAIPTPNAIDLRVLQAGIAAARRRIEILEEAVRSVELSLASISASSGTSSSTSTTTVTGTGTVTSVSATVPSFLSVSGSPITAVGTLAFSLATQPASTVFAGPVSGADAAPTFRSLGWDFDIPLFSTMSFTSGLDGTEIIAIERYGSFYWTTLGDLSALLSSPTFTWTDAPGDYTLGSGDMENGVSASSNSGMQTVTIPSGLDGNAVLVYQAGAAGIQVVPASGVTLHVRSGLTAVLSGQYAVATVIRRSADVWFIAGDLSA